MNLQQKQIAVERTLALVRQQGVIETDPVDFVEFLLAQVTYRDLDAIADDVVCFVLRWDDLCQHVKDRLDVQLAFVEAGERVPAAETRRAAVNIVDAIRAIVAGRLPAKDRMDVERLR